MKLLRNICVAACVLCSLPIISRGQEISGTSGVASTSQNRAFMSVAASSSIGSLTVSIRFPKGTNPDSVKAALNGKDVSARFQSGTCTGAVCMSATLSAVDGVASGQNVVTATARNQDGTASSSRVHFDGEAIAPMIANGIRSLVSPKTSASTLAGGALSYPTGSSFLPPTIAFNSVGPEPSSGGAPWFNLGTTQQVLTPGCTSRAVEYSVAFLDRRTLAPKTGGDDTAQCFNSGPALQQFLSGLASGSSVPNDLVIVGTNLGQTTDANIGPGQFDTRAIGGKVYNCPANTSETAANCLSAGSAASQDIPVQYLEIGVLNGKPGSAFEYYYTRSEGEIAAGAFAYGMLAEDASGNYNFQPTTNVEYTVAPGNTTSKVTVINPPSGPQASMQRVVYTPPAGSNGFWLLTLRRDNLASWTNCSQTPNPSVPSELDSPNCGMFYATSGGDPAVIGQLAADLQAVDRYQLAILTTVGNAGWTASQSSIQCGQSTQCQMAQNTGTISLANALQGFGIPDKTLLYLADPSPTYYTMVGAPGLGGPLTGHNVLSSSALTQQGHTGYVHGTFARGSDGLYEPQRSEQQSASADSANFQLGIVTAQAPVEWPEFVATPLLSYNGTNADSLAGQVDAYKYLSWYLLNTWYVLGQYGNGLQPGITGPQAYDIHYFFTGSLNTLIDYHTFDPLNAQFPTSSSTCNGCTWKNPNGDGTTLTFTQNDFNAVKAQMHNELVDLNNVLTLMVTGSTNVKDVVAAGNSNAALTLLQAYAAVQADITQASITPPPSTPVAISPWHIVQMIGSDVAPYVSLATDGVVNAGDIALADKAIGFIGDMFSSAGSVGGGLASGDKSVSKEIPRLDYKLDTTIASLAGLDLQDQFLAGFDATLDLITSDWGRLDALGNSAVKNQSLFAPTQVTQNQAINLITTAEQKSLYLSLIPELFQVHLWEMYGGSGYLDMAYGNNQTDPRLLYQNPSYAPGISKSYYTYNGVTFQGQEPSWQNSNKSNPIYPFQWAYDPPFVDVYVLSLPFTNPGASETFAVVMDNQLSSTLFGAQQGQVNFSFDEFVAPGGPMDRPITGASSALFNASVESLDTLKNSLGIPNAYVESYSQNTSGLTSKPAGSPFATLTTLVAPASALVGESAILSAKVTMQTGTKIPAGVVQFRDGATLLGAVALDASGSATYSTKGLTLGEHDLAAYFIPGDTSFPSRSDTQSAVIYADRADVSLSLNTGTLQTSYGKTTTPVQLQVASLNGMTGSLQFSCSGLPVNMSCSFTPAQASLSAGGTATTSFTISGTPLTATTSSFAVGRSGWKLMLSTLPLLLLLERLRRKRKLVARVPLLLVLLMMAMGGMVGCGGSGSSPAKTTFEETGSKTVLVTVTSGSLTRTAPLVLIVQ